MSDSPMKSLFLTVTALMLGHVLVAQTIARQTIGAICAANHTQNMSVIQVGGQPFQTTTYYSNTIESRPGFVQPPTSSPELIANTFRTTMTIFPNPAQDIVFFKTDQAVQNVDITVYDLTGRQVLSAYAADLSMYGLNCQQLSSGTYVVHVKDKQGNLYQSKLICNK